jgi:hypothetical protein
MKDDMVSEIKERICKLSKFRKQIVDLKLKWEDELLMLMADSSNETNADEIEKSLSLMRKVEQKVLLKHIKEVEKILGV